MRNSSSGGQGLHTIEEPDDLAVAVNRHESGAFERLVETYEPSLFRYAEKLLQNRDDAEEVVQDVFLRAHRALTRQYPEERCRALALRPWLFRIARNLAFNKRRGVGPKLEVPFSEADEARRWHLGGLSAPGDGAARIERQQDVAQLEKAMAMLPAEQRELIVLRFMEEMSYSEIAQTVGGNEASLRGKVFRSLRMLREALGAMEVTHALS
jgi:RNA polymerase sigma-70 factor, ECF subfamily